MPCIFTHQRYCSKVVGIDVTMPTIMDVEQTSIEESFSTLHLPRQEDAELQDAEEEEESDEGEESDDDNDGVVLGFLEELKNPYAQSRAGGTPLWLDPVNIPSEKDSCCGICGNPVQLLMQVYAKIDDAYHRTIYVFMCPSMACLQQDHLEQKKSKPSRSVKVFRCQIPRKNPFYDEHGKPLSSGVGLCSWCGTWRGGKICSGCKLARYCSRHHQVHHWKTGHATTCRKIQSSSKTGAVLSGLTQNQSLFELVNEHGSQVDCQIKHASNCLWPQFEVVDEDLDDSDPGDGSEIVPTSIITDVQGKAGDFNKQFSNMEATKDQKHWASFQEHIAKAPDQVLRYCWSKNAKILWPRIGGQPQNTDIPNCGVCNGPRYFEFQILPQLLYFFKVKNDIDSLDWSTMAVYTCAASCGENSVGYIEEFAWVQLAS